MKAFFNDNLLLSNDTSLLIYEHVKNLPIIDYHCHLNQYEIKEDISFNDIGELWLKGDHYKWRAMRLCGVNEYYITGQATFKEKFMKYAEIFPNLVGNPLYYWTQMELKEIFGINLPLNGTNALKIYEEANEKLKNISVLKLLEKFKVEYIATTDSPCDDLLAHGTYNNTKVAPTFRPDKLLNLDENEIELLAKTVGYSINSINDLLKAVEERINYFIGKGCKIADHGFSFFPHRYINSNEANKLFVNREKISNEEKHDLFGYLLVELAKIYKKNNILMQLHFGVVRNVNLNKFSLCGADSGFDVIASPSKIEDVILFLQQLDDDNRPKIALYTLNDSILKSLSCVTGAFSNVKIGPSWWFNDTVLGIKHNLQVISEYSVLGTNYGMLTDSRSFSSYVRFDFFRRILSDYLGDLVNKGEYDLEAAIQCAKNICYYNIKNDLGE